MPAAYIYPTTDRERMRGTIRAVNSEGSAHSTTSLDDERVRVSTWSFAADGENTGGPATFVEIELKR
jgi:hypothetical protein